jgi:hypothetical protein
VTIPATVQRTKSKFKSMRNIDIYELEKIQESADIKPFTKKVIGILLSSINDWSEPIFDLDNFEIEVSDFVEGEVTRQKIKSIRIDISKDAWKAESLSQLLELFALYDDDISLKEIILRLKESLS